MEDQFAELLIRCSKQDQIAFKQLYQQTSPKLYSQALRLMQKPELAEDVLQEGGDILVKLFQGEGTEQYKTGLKEKFQRVMIRKPQASRADSREFYILGRGYQV